MFDIGWPELFLVALVVLLVVGPSELPRVLRTVGNWINKAKSITNEFRTHMDNMVSESELDQIPKALEDSTSDTLGAFETETSDLEEVLDYDVDGILDGYKDDLEAPASNNEEISDTSALSENEESDAVGDKKDATDSDMSKVS